MINEGYMKWQIENRISDLNSIAVKDFDDEARIKLDLLTEILSLIEEQPQTNLWITDQVPLVDGRYLVIQKYKIDDYTEVNTALWKGGRWILERGDYNWKYHEHDMERIIVAWMPLPSKTMEFTL